MLTRQWDPFRELAALRNEVDRAFDNVGFGRWSRPFTRYSFLPGVAARAYPLLNIREDKDALYVDALAPGLEPKSLEITVVGDTLRIAGEKQALNPDIKPEAYHRNERSAGRFVRTTTLPAEINADKVKAEYKDGLLSIELPKSEKAKPRQIKVKVQ